MCKVSLKKVVLWNGLGFWGYLFGLQVANYGFLRELKDKGKRREPSMALLKFFQSSNLNKLMLLAQLIQKYSSAESGLLKEDEAIMEQKSKSSGCKLKIRNCHGCSCFQNASCAGSVDKIG